MLNFGSVTQKRHIIARKHVFLRILRQNPWGVLAVDSQKIAESTLVPTGLEIAHAQKRNPVSDVDKTL